MIKPGDVVVAIFDGGHDRDGLPLQRPIAGKTYRVEAIYPMNYGLGCTLAGMDPWPYKGYFLRVDKNKGPKWYFAKLASADEEFTSWLRSTLSASAAPPVPPSKSSPTKRRAGR